MSTRPKQGQKAPPPAYLDPREHAVYCHTCGRLIGVRKIKKAGVSSSEAKYCSDKCKRHKTNALDVQIESILLSLLLEKPKVSRGSPRRLIPMSEVEKAVAERAVPAASSTKSSAESNRDVDETTDVESEFHIEESTEGEIESMVDGIAKDDDTPAGGGPAAHDPNTSQQLGQQRANLRENIRNAARRAIIFGLLIPERTAEPNTDAGSSQAQSRRKCEAVVGGRIVEPSFAKGDWAIRWRDEV